MKIVNLSKTFENIDPEFIKYNGAMLPVGGSTQILLAYRATAKPNLNKNIKPYPYTNADGSYWHNRENHIGVIVFTENNGVFTIGKSIRVYLYVHDENVGPEDPRLYYRNNNGI